MCVRGPVILSLAERELKDGICWLEHSRDSTCQPQPLERILADL